MTNHCQAKAKVDRSQAEGGKSTAVRLQAQLDHLVIILIKVMIILFIFMIFLNILIMKLKEHKKHLSIVKVGTMMQFAQGLTCIDQHVHAMDGNNHKIKTLKIN